MHKLSMVISSSMQGSNKLFSEYIALSICRYKNLIGLNKSIESVLVSNLFKTLGIIYTYLYIQDVPEGICHDSEELSLRYEYRRPGKRSRYSDSLRAER